jgi:spermidine synthase
VLALSAAFLLGARWLVVAVVLAGLVLVPPGAVKSVGGVVHEEESRYQFIQVRERADGSRRLYLNEGVAVHSLWRPESVLTGGVWDTFLALPSLIGREPERMAVLGNAGGTVARAYGVYYPETAIDGVEIDPAVTDVGERWFGMRENRRLTTHDADARPFLRRTDERFDLVVVDAYHQPYVPFYLATKEFFELVRSRLRPGGAVALNVATVPGDRRLERELSGTLATVFPEVRVWPALRFNHIVIGFTRPTRAIEARVPAGELAPLAALARRDLSGAVPPSDDPWTDDHAPVEWVTDRMIVEYAARGGDLDEELLPTAPR